MDKIFRFSKWFVLFCALLVIARLTQQYVADKAMEARASDMAERIFGWQWLNPTGAVARTSQAKVLTAKVVKRGPNDGQVKVAGNQVVMKENTPFESKFSAVITLYKDKDRWKLGSVEAE